MKIYYNNKKVNYMNYGDGAFGKLYRHDEVYVQRMPSNPTTKILAHLTLNDGSIVDIEDDGTGALKKRMMSAYSANTVSVEILLGCTRLERANSTGTFQEFHQLTAVTMPDTLITIDDNTFLGTSLVDVVVPDSVQTISGGAFARISTLHSITFGSGCTSIGRAMTQESKQTKIIFKSPQNPITKYEYWFYYGARNGVIEYPCDGTGYDVMMANFKKETSNVGYYGTVNTWTEQCKQPPLEGKARLTLSDGSIVEIPGSGELTSAETSAYSATTIAVEIGSGCTRIGTQAFRQHHLASDPSILTSVTIPDNVTSIGGWAFEGCDSLTSIVLPNSITGVNLSQGVFEYCTGLTSVTLPSGITSIQNTTFASCTSLNTISIPESVTWIGYMAFYHCSGLTSIDLPSGLTSLESLTFEGCNKITSITIPSGVTSIKKECFSGCTSLNSITVESTTPPTLGIHVFDQTNNCPIYVPAESVETYKSATNWSTYASRISAIP